MMTVSAIDREQILIRRLQSPYIAQTSPFQPVVPILPSISTIAPAAAVKQSISSFRPVLEKPRHYMYSLLDLQNDIERVDGMYNDAFATEIKSDLVHIQELNKQKIEKLRETAKGIKAKKTWSAWNQVAQYVSSAAAIAVGTSCLASGLGAIAGGLLIASGAIGLANRVAIDSGAVKSIVSHFVASTALQAKRIQQFEVGMTTLSLGLAAAGSINAYHTGILTTETIQKAVSLLIRSSQIFNAGTTFGKALVDRRVLNCKAQLQHMQVKTTEAYTEVKTNANQISKTIKCSEEIARVIKNLIDSSII